MCLLGAKVVSKLTIFAKLQAICDVRVARDDAVPGVKFLGLYFLVPVKPFKTRGIKVHTQDLQPPNSTNWGAGGQAKAQPAKLQDKVWGQGTVECNARALGWSNHLRSALSRYKKTATGVPDFPDPFVSRR